VPTVAVNSLVTDYMRSRYHTQHDELGIVDFANLADMTRVYARLVVEADRRAGDLLDPAARVVDLRRRGRLEAAADAGADTAALEAALAAYADAARRSRGASQRRRAFATVARAVEGLNARDKQSLAHLQPLLDVEAIDDARTALARGDRPAAVRAAARCGRNPLALHLSREVFDLHTARHSPDHPGIAWGGPHVSWSPDLWDELASLRGEPGSRPLGPWLDRSLGRNRGRAAQGLDRRLRRIADALTAAAWQLESA